MINARCRRLRLNVRLIRAFVSFCHIDESCEQSQPMPPIEPIPKYGVGFATGLPEAAGMRLLADGLACTRGGREVFSQLGFSVASGEALIVTGPNGVGKTSLLRTVAGLLVPVAGRIVLENGHPDRTIAEQCHYLAHQDALKPSLSVLENLRFWIEYLGNAAMHPSKALATVQLDALADLPAGYLSAGQRRRLSVARLIAAKRALWLLDEPTAALDVAGEARLTEIMQAHLGSGGIILAATHGPLRLAPCRELRLGKSP
jgi:heme exporter protein A